MKFNLSIIFSSVLVTLVCCWIKEDKYKPSNCLTASKQQRIIQQMVRYASKLAPEATHQTKFSHEFDWYYNRAADECRILFCITSGDSSFQLLVARKARSLTPMEEGIALKVSLDAKDSLIHYEEVFRMWKMPSDTLVKRGRYLFERMVNHEDLTIYYSKFQKDRFIEFPDERFTFDISKRRWRDSELDSIKF